MWNLNFREKILTAFNNTRVDYPKYETIQSLIAKQVEKTPDRVAVVFQDQELTYKELDEKANQLAHLLKENYVKEGTVVGVSMPSSLELLVSQLSILKLGGIIVCIDLKNPKARRDFIIKDCKLEILLTSFINNEEDVKCKKLNVELKNVSHYSKDNIDYQAKATNLAYIVYTSGSTGNPKGVLLEHRGIINHIFTKISVLKISSEDNLCNNLNSSFVASIWQNWAPLITGSKLIIFEEKVNLHIYDLINRAKEDGINVLEIVPSALKIYLNLLDEGMKKIELPDLRYLVLTGERVINDLVNNFYKKYKIGLVNAYGQSECSDDTLHYHIPYNINTDIVPIGIPSNNTQVYILDSNNQLMLPGEEGELCIAGDGVARGYLNREDLTKDKFMDNPFGEGKIYKTGDLARWLPDGHIEFLGRKDDQVKIRGNRVELGEIESILNKYRTIKESYIIVKNTDNSQELVAYIVPNQNWEEKIKIDNLESEIRLYLQNKLPDYMIPSFFVLLDKLPLNPNGKIDRTALPDILDKKYTANEYVLPRNLVELKLVKIWKHILKIKEISINSNFFYLGGHSLKATQLVSRIEKDFNVKMGLREIFELKTIQNLAVEIQKAKRTTFVKIEKVEAREYHPVSSAQKRLIVLNQMKKDSINYNLPIAKKIIGHLNKKRLIDVFYKMLKRHESLRTSFSFIDGEPVQKISNFKDLDLEVKILKADRGEEKRIIKNFVRPFDLSVAPLIRICIIELSINEHILVIDMHHTIADGVSLNILIKEIRELYRDHKLPEIKIHYKDFVNWQNKLFKTKKIEEQKRFWLERFSVEIPILDLPVDYLRPDIQSFEGSIINFELDENLTESLKNLCKKTETTLYMVLLAVYNVLLSKYSSQDDIIIGSPIAGRNHSDIENIVGMFVNTLALRNYPKSSKTFIDFLDEVKENILQSFEHQDYQFEKLVEDLNLRRDMGRNPLFDVMFAMENMDIETLQTDELEFIDYNFDFNVSKFDLTLFAEEIENKLKCQLEYATRLFKKDTIERLGNHFIKVVKEVVKNVDIEIGRIEVVSEIEREQLLYTFNDTESQYPKERTIHELFEEQAEKTPENVAVVYKDTFLTYQELNQKANQLARVLRTKGVKAEMKVGIMPEQSLEMVIGVLAILKAGGAYLPIDQSYPKTRIKFIIQDSKIDILLTQSKLKEKIESKVEVLDLEDKELYKGVSSNLKIMNSSNSLAYIIYTSGSTGRPKGVMVEHRSLINLCFWHNERYSVTEADRATKYASFGFDASVWEIYPYLICGASLYIIEKELKLDIKRLNEYYENNAISISFLPTQMCEKFLQLENSSLRMLLTGGDKLNNYQKKKYTLVNNYGPTEVTVVSASFTVEKEYKNIPIGRPIFNLHIYILDENHNLQPIGVPGELCIAGDGLARGYLYREELTGEKFVTNPFGVGKMYKTGDLARWLSDGNIEYLGRLDYQVKIRGYRIELNEITNILLEHGKINDCVVIAIDTVRMDKQLVAYYVSETEIPTNAIKKYLADKLPEYMIPSIYMHLDHIPLTSNGKIDRKSLPIINMEEQNIGVEFKKAETDVEMYLSRLWQKILGRDSVGIYDNFFDIGGNSMSIVAMCSELDKDYKGLVTVPDLFAYPTIEKLSKFMEVGGEQSKKININGFTLPAKFFNNAGGFVEELLEFTIGQEVYNGLNNLATANNINLLDVLLGCYVYLLHEVSQQDMVWVQVIIPSLHNKMLNLGIKFQIINNFNNLFKAINTKLSHISKNDQYSLEHAKRLLISKKINEIIPLFIFGENIDDNQNKAYDIVISIKDGESSLRCLCKYNAARLIDTEVFSLIKDYVKVIKLIASNFK